MNKQINEEFHLNFEIYDEEEERFETVTTEHENLFEAFAYAMEILYPECEFEYELKEENIKYIKYTYQVEDLDECGEGEIEYTVEAMNEYIKDFVENNDTDYSNMSIVNWTKFCEEIKKERIIQSQSKDDTPF